MNHTINIQSHNTSRTVTPHDTRTKGQTRTSGQKPDHTLAGHTTVCDCELVLVLIQFTITFYVNSDDQTTRGVIDCGFGRIQLIFTVKICVFTLE